MILSLHLVTSDESVRLRPGFWRHFKALRGVIPIFVFAIIQ